MFTIRHSSHIKFQISSYIWNFDLFPENSFQVSARIIEDKMVKMVVRAMGSVLTRLLATHESSISSRNYLPNPPQSSRGTQNIHPA